MRIHNRRILRFGLGAFLMSTAACSAIAGLDGEFGVDDAGSASNLPDGNGVDGNNSSDGGNKDGSTTTTDGGQTDSQAADTGVQDQFVPPDACDSYRLDAGPADAKPPPTENCSAGGRYLCWTFQGSGQPTTSPWGWQEQDDSGAGLTAVEGTQTDGSLHVTLPATAPAGSGANLFITDWESGTPQIDPLAIPQNTGLEFTFKFKLIAIHTNVTLGAIRINGAIYGLTVYAPRCGGPIVVGQTDDDPTSSQGGAVVELNKQYLGSVRVQRHANDTWEGRIAISGVTIATRAAAAIPAGPPTGVAVGVGFIKSSQTTGPSEAFFDDTVAFP